ncbi:MAG TPA: chemotaxis protein CheD [Spirochaetota bacterium]|nr:chemotaxis protein CheD [Spirochaetota bacterium]HPJ33873.1 chemotaxis protein CheD [Spirochaetota bacterium]
MAFELLNVGIADYGVSGSPNILRTILGSCVGICLYDPVSRIGGLSHIMLPTSKKEITNIKKYADTAIPSMLHDMLRTGAERTRVIAKITGGATMFKHTENSLMGDIGRNNINSVKSILTEMGIKIIAEDVGGDYGRTIDFYLETGEIKIKTIGKENKII